MTGSAWSLSGSGNDIWSVALRSRAFAIRSNNVERREGYRGRENRQVDGEGVGRWMKRQRERGEGGGWMEGGGERGVLDEGRGKGE